jgi:tRNA(fMet)-specific endonuclease VapC
MIIAFERGRLDVNRVLGQDDAVISAITAMELLVGVERADQARRQQRALHVDAVLASVPVVDYTLDIARVHARLTVAAMRSGKLRSAHDMIVAATAAAESRVLLTTDGSADFADLPGVVAELFSAS